MRKCKDCQADMKLLFTSLYCPNNCDKPELKLNNGASISFVDNLTLDFDEFFALTYHYKTIMTTKGFETKGTKDIHVIKRKIKTNYYQMYKNFKLIVVTGIVVGTSNDFLELMNCDYVKTISLNSI